MVRIKVMVEGGKANTKDIGPKLGPYKLNISEVIKKINEKTKAFEGMTIPVEIEIDPNTKEFEIFVGSPPTSQLILKELGLEKGAQRPKEEVIGNLSMEQVIKIALMKKDNLHAKTLKAAVKTIVGVCVSMGVNIEGKDPRVITKEIDQGVYDDIIKKYESEWK